MKTTLLFLFASLGTIASAEPVRLVNVHAAPVSFSFSSGPQNVVLPPNTAHTVQIDRGAVSQFVVQDLVTSLTGGTETIAWTSGEALEITVKSPGATVFGSSGGVASVSWPELWTCFACGLGTIVLPLSIWLPLHAVKRGIRLGGDI